MTVVLGPTFFFPTGPTVSAVGNPPNIDEPAVFGTLSPQLQGLGTRVVYIDPRGNLFNLAGPFAGQEGVRLAAKFEGDQQWPFKQVLTNSPYVMGADINRQNIPERNFNFGIIIGSHAPPMSEYQYRIAESRWWAGQDESNDGWMGTYTRFSGWRWIPVRPLETVRSPELMDPVTYGNNVSRWDITWLAARPYFTKPANYLTWQAFTAGPPKRPPAPQVSASTPGLAFTYYYWGTLPIANCGDMPSFVSFLITSPGQAIVQDNESTRLVTMPNTPDSVGTYLCDTEPSHRTLTAAGDPVDDLMYDLQRQSQILDFHLTGVPGETAPLMLAFQNRFMFQIPPNTATTFKVGHSNPGGSITAIIPQRFKRSR
jgi:hypothetical protein